MARNLSYVFLLYLYMTDLTIELLSKSVLKLLASDEDSYPILLLLLTSLLRFRLPSRWDWVTCVR